MQTFEYRDGDGLSHKVTPIELKQLAARGAIDAHTPLRKIGASDWSTAGNVRGLVFPAPDANDAFNAVLVEVTKTKPDPQPSGEEPAFQAPAWAATAKPTKPGERPREWRGVRTGAWLLAIVFSALGGLTIAGGGVSVVVRVYAEASTELLIGICLYTAVTASFFYFCAITCYFMHAYAKDKSATQ